MFRVYAYAAKTDTMVPFVTTGEYDTGKVVDIMLRTGYDFVVAFKREGNDKITEADMRDDLRQMSVFIVTKPVKDTEV